MVCFWAIRHRALGAVLALSLAAAGCSPKPHIIVGSKNTTESAILGEIAAQQIERRLGFRVQRSLQLGGTLMTYQAVREAQIDLYPEYLGTAYMTLLHHASIEPVDTMTTAVRSELAAQQQLRWMNPLGFENGFAMVVRKETADAAHLQTLSDAMKQPGWKLGCGFEFLERPDGFRAFLAAYPDMQFTAAPVSMELAALYPALTKGDVNIVSGNTTDPSIASPSLVVLRDDNHAFPPNPASYVARFDTLRRLPALETALEALSGRISQEAMREMNAEVEVRHRAPAQVAAEFLKTVP
jgi:osmoprotectant transport system permease protein